MIPLSAIGAWLDFSVSNSSNDPDLNVPCNNWTVSVGSQYNAATALPTGVSVSNYSVVPHCGSTLPLACCTSPSYVRLRGYTAFTSTGAIGSRLIANSKCHAEFPGSHLCNMTEYRLARSLLAPPSPGAWLDFAVSNSSTDPDLNVPCNNFTVSVGSQYNAAAALPTGVAVSNYSVVPHCGSTMPLACCD
jgi:hypothetical protein